MEQNEKIGYKDIFKQKEYMKMMVAALINRFGDSIDAIASTWIVYELTGSAVWSAVIFGVNKVPSVFVTPLAGAWVEGRNKKAIMIITDLIRAVCVAFVASGYLLGFLQPWMLLVTTCIISTVEAFRGPAGSALTPRVLKAEYYEYGMSLMSTFSSVTELAGTMPAGGIIAVIGAAGAIYLDMATFLLSALIICFVNTREERSRSQIFDGKAYITNLKEGFSYVRKSHEVCYLMVIVLFMNGILVPLNSLEAPMVDEILHGGAEMLSLLSAALTVGMLFGSVTYPVVKKHMSGKKNMVIACVVVAVFYIGIPLCEPFFVNRLFRYGVVIANSLALGYVVAATGAFLSVASVKYVNQEYLARTSGIMSAASIAAMPVLSFIISGLVSFVTTAQCFIFAGVCALLECIWILKNKGIEGNM